MKHFHFGRTIYSLVLGLVIAFGLTAAVAALGSEQNPQSGSSGLQGTISSPPPTRGARISLPTGGQTFTSTPIQVSGTCPDGLLVKVFTNNIFVGSADCDNGSFTLQVDLFSGENDLVARVYDSLDQPGPDSNTVIVTFQDALFIKFGSHVSVTSNFAKIGADPGATLSWPIIISGGSGPYAVSIDWGDGSGNDLKSVAFVGQVNVDHVYKNAGSYTVVIKVTDANGTTAFLQVVGVGNGKVTQSSSSTNKGAATIITKKIYLIWPLLLIFPIALIAFWLGRRYELQSLRQQIEKQSAIYDQEDKR
ncbi:MAG: PKD domain-containing protein [Candidatus Saccharimonadales bacterium]